MFSIGFMIFTISQMFEMTITPELADVENADLTGFFVKNTKKSANFT